MPRETKKRKLDEDDKATGSNSTLKDVSSLKKALAKCDAAASIQAISNSLDDLSPETIDTLTAVLMPALRTDKQPKHCVRCHQTYRESTNKIASCVIKHTEPSVSREPDPNGRKPWNMIRRVRYSCCEKRDSWSDYGSDSDEDFGSDEMDDTDEPGNLARREPDYGTCFSAKHTTDPTSIQYYSTRDEKKQQEKGIDYSGWNANVRTCKMSECGGNKKPKKK